MTVDVTWNGVTLATGAPVRAEQGVGRWFIELEQPMPVGTTLEVAGEVAGTVRVARVHEGIGAGMVVLLEVAAAVPAPPDATAAAAATMVAEGDPQDGVRTAAEPTASEAAPAGDAAVEDAGEPEAGKKDGNANANANANANGKGSRRKRSRR